MYTAEIRGAGGGGGGERGSEREKDESGESRRLMSSGFTWSLLQGEEEPGSDFKGTKRGFSEVAGLLVSRRWEPNRPAKELHGPTGSEA